MLIQPWQRLRPTTNDTDSYINCLPTEDDISFLCNKYSLSLSSRNALLQFHLRHKSLLVPLSDVATAYLLRLLFETSSDGSEHDHNDGSLPTSSDHKYSVVESWIRQNITLLHNLDGNKTLSLCKECDSFPFNVPLPVSTKASFTFVDVFAGIGGFRIAMEALGGRCVGSCEVDPYARNTYRQNFDTRNEFYVSDIARLDIDPQQVVVDVLCGGFPCQSFSTLARDDCNSELFSDNCKRGGLETPNKGKLFFQLLRVLRKCQPKIFVFENVKGLVNLDGGSHLQQIVDLLRESGYHTSYEIVDTAWFLPQRRERIFFVGVRRDLLGDSYQSQNYVAFTPREIKQKYQLYDNDIQEGIDRYGIILRSNSISAHHHHNRDKSSWLQPSRLGDFFENDHAVVKENSHTFLSSHQWNKILSQKYIQIHADGSGQLITADEACVQTLVASYRQSYLIHSQFVVARNNLHYTRQQYELLTESQKRRSIPCDFNSSRKKHSTEHHESSDTNQTLPRFFTPRECCRFQGFPEEFILPCHKQQDKMYRFYRQIGNSVSPPVAIAVAENAINKFLLRKQAMSYPVFDALLKASPCREKILDLIDKRSS